MAEAVCSSNCWRTRSRVFRSVIASACGRISAILRLAILRMSLLPNRLPTSMPAVLVSVAAWASAGSELTRRSSMMIRLRAPTVVVPRVRTVTGPCVPAVVEWLVASSLRSTTARSDDGTKSSSTSPLVWPLPRTRVPSTTSFTGDSWSTTRLTAEPSRFSSTSR